MISFDAFIAYFQSIPYEYMNSIGLFIVFLATIAEGIPVLGSFVPGQTLIIISGLLSYVGVIDLKWLIIVAVIGAVIGDNVAYYMGKKLGIGFLKKYGKYMLLDDYQIKKTQELLSTNLGKTIFIGRFHNLARAYIPFIAGLMEVSFFRFFLWNVVTGAVWATTWILVGYFAGKSYEIILTYVGYTVGFIIFAFIVGYYFYNKYEDFFKRISEYQVGMIFIFLFSLISFYALHEFLFKGYLDALNNYVLYIFDSFYNYYLVVFMKYFSYLANKYLILPLVLAISGVLVIYKKYKDALFLMLSVYGVAFVVWALKHIYYVSRPASALIDKTTSSFPSGHVALATIVALSIYYLYVRKIKNEELKDVIILGLLVYVVLISLSRLYLKVHWFSDVLASMLIAFAVYSLVVIGMEYYEKWFNKSS